MTCWYTFAWQRSVHGVVTLLLVLTLSVVSTTRAFGQESVPTTVTSPPVPAAPAPGNPALALSPPAAEQPSLLRRWWFWTVVGAAAAVTGGIIVTSSRGQAPPPTDLGNQEFQP